MSHQCGYGDVFGPTCYCHRPGTEKLDYGEGCVRHLCGDHYKAEDMRLHRPEEFRVWVLDDKRLRDA